MAIPAPSPAPGSASAAPGGASAPRWACWWPAACRWTSTSSATRSFSSAPRPEQARIDPDQLLILLDHIRCAAFELPFRDGDAFGKEDLGEMLAYLQEHGVLHREGGQWHWMADSYPANSVSLRSVAEGNFVVIDTTGGAQTVIAEVDYSSAPETLYEGAIYMVQSRALPGGAARLGGAQGLRHPHPRRLLHRCHRLHPAEDPGGRFDGSVD